MLIELYFVLLISCAFNWHVICIHVELVARMTSMNGSGSSGSEKKDKEGIREDPAQWSKGPKDLLELTLT